MDNDAELARRGMLRDERAFAALMQRHLEAVQRLIRYQVGRAETEDVLQETLVQAWQDLPNLREPERVKAWLLQVARNRIIRNWWSTG